VQPDHSSILRHGMCIARALPSSRAGKDRSRERRHSRDYAPTAPTQQLGALFDLLHPAVSPFPERVAGSDFASFF
jgi:hypothetical protein